MFLWSFYHKVFWDFDPEYRSTEVGEKVGVYFLFCLGLQSYTYMKHVLLACGMTLLSWLMAILVATMIAVGLGVCRSTMSWYSTPSLILFIYVLPTIATVIGVQNLGSYIHRRVNLPISMCVIFNSLGRRAFYWFRKKQ